MLRLRGQSEEGDNRRLQSLMTNTKSHSMSNTNLAQSHLPTCGWRCVLKQKEGNRKRNEDFEIFHKTPSAAQSGLSGSTADSNCETIAAKPLRRVDGAVMVGVR